MFTHTSDSKYQLVGVGDLVHPGSCLGCGNGNCPDGYINLAVSYDYEGQMYLCHTCVIEIAEIIGCMIPAEVEQLKDAAFRTSEENAQLRSEMDAANERLAAFDLLLDRSGSASSLTTGLGVTAVNSSDEDSSIVSDETERGTTESLPEPNQPVEGSGPGDASEPERVDATGGDSGIRLKI